MIKQTQATEQQVRHTPGPWHYGELFENADGEFYGIGDGSTAIALVRSTSITKGQEAQANARLIAAAPELLAACEETERALAQLKSMGDKQDWEAFAPLHESLTLARSALAKVKGGQ